MSSSSFACRTSPPATPEPSRSVSVVDGWTLTTGPDGARTYLRSFRVVTDRETGLVEQMATPYSQPRDRDGRAREQEVVRELAALLIQLHATLLRAELIRGGRA